MTRLGLALILLRINIVCALRGHQPGLAVGHQATRVCVRCGERLP